MTLALSETRSRSPVGTGPVHRGDGDVTHTFRGPPGSQGSSPTGLSTGPPFVKEPRWGEEGEQGTRQARQRLWILGGRSLSFLDRLDRADVGWSTRGLPDLGLEYHCPPGRDRPSPATRRLGRRVDRCVGTNGASPLRRYTERPVGMPLTPRVPERGRDSLPTLPRPRPVLESRPRTDGKGPPGPGRRA